MKSKKKEDSKVQNIPRAYEAMIDFNNKQYWIKFSNATNPKSLGRKLRKAIEALNKNQWNECKTFHV